MNGVLGHYRVMDAFKMIFRREGAAAAVSLAELLALAALISAAFPLKWAAIPLCVLTVGCVLRVISEDISPAYKLGLAVPMLLFPLHGGVFYLLFVRGIARNKLEKRISTAFVGSSPAPATKGDILGNYLAARGMPACGADDLRYYPFGDAMFAEMLNAVRGARERVFLEFFIVSEGTALSELVGALAERAAAGVDVRVLIDGLGSAFVRPRELADTLHRSGIALREFNRLSPFGLSAAGIRDHRKILTVDGDTAFCGGINIADEYMGRKVRFGVWKDGGFSLRGEAAGRFERMFLQMWRLTGGDAPDISAINNAHNCDGGIVQPFGDVPLDGCRVSLTVYLHIISRANRYVYIMTPYLVCDDELIGALCAAAGGGVDVRLILPGIPDKKYVNIITKSYYSALIRAGVRVCEYAPGFVHTKLIVSDDEIAAMGTVNLDYRSMSEHFECGCVIREKAFIEAAKRDIEATLCDCTEAVLQSENGSCCPKTALLSEMTYVTSPFVKIARIFLKLLTPLM